MKTTALIIAAAASLVIGGAFTASAYENHSESLTISIGGFTIELAGNGSECRECREYHNPYYACPPVSHHHVEKGYKIPDPPKHSVRNSPPKEVTVIREAKAPSKQPAKPDVRKDRAPEPRRHR